VSWFTLEVRFLVDLVPGPRYPHLHDTTLSVGSLRVAFNGSAAMLARDETSPVAETRSPASLLCWCPCRHG
jgi:hypothetical protein